MGSTSQGVENVFKKARKALEKLGDEDRKNNISMIFFDEMGLAEHSPNNPLKVIHSELEYDLNEGNKKVAFVGISNWTLDASKMNRGMFLSIPEPDEDDIKNTAFTIGRSYDDDLGNKYKVFYEFLGSTYFEYKTFLKNEHSEDGKEDFHGNRDFYHLVKNAARTITEEFKLSQVPEKELEKIAVKSAERNFGGLQFKKKGETSLLKIKEILNKKYSECKVENSYDVLNRITENIKDIKSRYLLVISKSSVSTFLIASVLSVCNKNYSIYIGSKFPDDLRSEEYTLKILNKIQLHMEQGKVLILKNLESVYPSLYDLFNQNFTVVSQKNYARIAVGYSTNDFYLVNNEFRCIVIVDNDQIEHEEAPFLNRFEKHIVSFDYLIKDEEIRKESERIYDILNGMIQFKKNIYKGINYDLKKIFINSDLEEIFPKCELLILSIF
jgi:hypothetical protein